MGDDEEVVGTKQVCLHGLFDVVVFFFDKRPFAFRADDRRLLPFPWFDCLVLDHEKPIRTRMSASTRNKEEGGYFESAMWLGFSFSLLHPLPYLVLAAPDHSLGELQLVARDGHCLASRLLHRGDGAEVHFFSLSRSVKKRRRKSESS